MYFVYLEKVFLWSRKEALELVIRKKGIPEVLLRSVMCLYEGGKTCETRQV